jgi:hypothetical protein
MQTRLPIPQVQIVQVLEYLIDRQHVHLVAADLVLDAGEVVLGVGLDEVVFDALHEQPAEAAQVLAVELVVALLDFYAAGVVGLGAGVRVLLDC